VTGSAWAALIDLVIRVGPVLIFLIAITVVAEIADAAGVFDIAGHWAARAGHGRTWLLWLLIVGLSSLSTIVLSLDTTAVLLTPVVIAVARQLRLNPLPFAMTTVWLANTASLLLPVSNLTNLLALHRFSALGLGYSGYISLALWPAVAAIGATVAVLAVIHLHDLKGRYRPEAPPAPHDRTLLIVASSVCVALGPAFVSGIAPGDSGIGCNSRPGHHPDGAQPSSLTRGQDPLAHRAGRQRLVRPGGPRSGVRLARPASRLGGHRHRDV
jgi:arsenical pump membrane protein